jgi:CubicO group peptidase (beta-lactamase class C family)
VIEAVTGQSYADHVQQSILAPCGVTDMQIAGDTAAERQVGEAMYVGKVPDAPYALPVRRMDSHGGWIATPADLLRFLLRVDGFAPPPDLLAPQTIIDMTTPSTANGGGGYARGWAVNAAGTRWHDGVLPGTQSIMVRTAGQHEWAAVCNTGMPLTGLAPAFDQLMWNVDSVT